MENERIGYHGLRFLSMRKRCNGNLESIQMYLGKRQKIYVCIMGVEMEILKKAMVGNEMFEMHKEEWHSNL